jgi:glutamyl-tRNA reductase
MHSQLAVIHRLHKEGSRPVSAESSPFFSWATCLRTIQVGQLNDLKPTIISSADEVFTGQNAYVFLLEVVCGLKSPILGETEVHGQYREFLDRVKASADKDLYQVLHQVHVHAKNIRSEYLQGLGSQSYGSYCRKKVRSFKEVNLVGAGHLTQELLPWLNKLNINVRLHVRSVNDRVIEIQKKYPKVLIESLETLKNPLAGVLIVAAPVNSKHLGEWLVDQPLELILDLRGESAHDPLVLNPQMQVTLESLKDIFSKIESSRVFIRNEVARAQEVIVKKAELLEKQRTDKERIDESSNSSPKERFSTTASVHGRTGTSKI